MSLYINGRKWPEQVGTNVKQYYGDGNSGHIWYNGTQFELGSKASCNIRLLPGTGGIVQVGDAGSTSHTLNANDDLFISGKLEVDGYIYTDSILYVQNAMYFGALSTYFGGFSQYTDDGLHFCTGHTDNAGCGNIIITNATNMAKDHDHETVSVNPTLFIHSSTDPDSVNTQWGAFSHSTTQFEVTTGLGAIALRPVSGASVLLDNNGSNTNSTPLELTANSGGTIQSATLQCMYGADPYLRICAPNDAGTATSVIDMHDTVIAFVTDNQVDIGATGANRPKDYYGSGKAVLGGDIEAAGGYQTQLNYWYQDDVAASQSAAVLYMDSVANGRSEVPTIKAGSVVGLAVYSNAARAAGTLTCQVTIDGTAITGHDAVLNGTDTQTKCVTITKDEHTFTAGQRIGVKLTTDGDWLPTTADITVTVLIEQ